VDSSALGADGSSLAQSLDSEGLTAPTSADERRANCPRLYTAPYTAFEKESKDGTLSHGRGGEVDSSALGAEVSALA
jgi:hypothetical protein